MLRKHKKAKIEISKYNCARLKSDHNNKSLISTFSSAKNPSLAAHLQRRAWHEEQNNKRAYFLVKEGNKIVLYFSLQCGLLIKSHEKYCAVLVTKKQKMELTTLLIMTLLM